MATNIPPHNLGEVADALVAMIDAPDIDVKGLLKYVKGPRLPDRRRAALEPERDSRRLRVRQGALGVRGQYKVEQVRAGASRSSSRRFRTRSTSRR
jgi:DNA gyrase subunit A